MYFIIDLFYSGADGITIVLTALAFLLAIVVGIVFHELAHGWAALMNGDMTAKVNGRLSFNPIVHFDPIGFLMLLFVGFGFAKPVPVNPYNFKKPKKGLLMVSLAGVVMNFIIAVFFMLIMTVILFIASNVYITTEAGFYALDFFYMLSYFMIMINLNLMLFNLLPLGMLDGLKVLEALTKRGNKVTEFLRTYGQYIFWALIGLSFIADYLGDYVNVFYYLDVLGMYLFYGRYYIAGSIMSLFTLMFGMGTAFDFFPSTFV